MKMKVFYVQVVEFEAIIETELSPHALTERGDGLVPEWARIVHANMEKGTDYPVRTGEYIDLEGFEIIKEGNRESSAKAN